MLRVFATCLGVVLALLSAPDIYGQSPVSPASRDATSSQQPTTKRENPKIEKYLRIHREALEAARNNGCLSDRLYLGGDSILVFRNEQGQPVKLQFSHMMMTPSPPGETQQTGAHRHDERHPTTSIMGEEGVDPSEAARAYLGFLVGNLPLVFECDSCQLDSAAIERLGNITFMSYTSPYSDSESLPLDSIVTIFVNDRMPSECMFLADIVTSAIYVPDSSRGLRFAKTASDYELLGRRPNLMLADLYNFRYKDCPISWQSLTLDGRKLLTFMTHFVLFHELAHALYGHKPSYPEFGEALSDRQWVELRVWQWYAEVEADLYATKLLRCAHDSSDLDGRDKWLVGAGAIYLAGLSAVDTTWARCGMAPAAIRSRLSSDQDICNSIVGGVMRYANATAGDEHAEHEYQQALMRADSLYADWRAQGRSFELPHVVRSDVLIGYLHALVPTAVGEHDYLVLRQMCDTLYCLRLESQEEICDVMESGRP